MSETETPTKTQKPLSMDLDALPRKLDAVHTSLQASSATLQDAYKHLSEHPDAHPFEAEEMRSEYQTYLSDYERTYDIANREYQASIEGLSEAYLSLCPSYKGPSLPRPSFISSKQDICDLYGLFLIMGIAHLYGIH